ncbi:unnamed protein product [Sphagnum tenellum]
MHRSKTLHLPVEMNGYVVEGLADTETSMSVLAAAVVREMGMMHLVTGSENYKTASIVVTRALGRIDEIPIKVGGHRIVTKEGASSTSDSDADTDDSEHCDLEPNQLKQIDCEDEFGDTKMEELVKSEGPQEILQLILQEQADNFMKEEITDADDYVDWIQWVSDAEQGKQVISTTPKHEKAPVLL